MPEYIWDSARQEWLDPDTRQEWLAPDAGDPQAIESIFTNEAEAPVPPRADYQYVLYQNGSTNVPSSIAQQSSVAANQTQTHDPVHCAYTGTCLRRTADGFVDWRDRNGDVQVAYCDNCGDWFCIRHNHVGRYRCHGCGTTMSRCEDPRPCSDCGERFCDSCAQDHMNADGQERQELEEDGVPYRGGFREAELLFDGSLPVPGVAEGERYMSLELEAELTGFGSTPLTLPERFGITTDGSLNNGIEVTLPPSRWDSLADNVNVACRALSEAGYEIMNSCGMHTHIDLRDKRSNPVFLSHLFSTFFAVEDILFAMQSTSRHRNHYCRPLREEFKFYDTYGQRAADFDFTFYGMEKSIANKQRMAQTKRYKGGPRYRSFNFHSVYYRGSLEIRLHEGCLDPAVILPWMELIQKIVARVEKGITYKTLTKLLSLNVGPEKLAMFRRVFKLTPRLDRYVKSRIRRAHPTGTFRLAYNLGTAKRGRAKSLMPRRTFRITHRRCRWCGAIQPLTGRCRYCSEQPVLPPNRDTDGLMDELGMAVNTMGSNEFYDESSYRMMLSGLEHDLAESVSDEY